MITQEHQLIPYHTSPLPQGPWLVFAPHPDDETFGMGGTLLLAKRREIGVALVILTNETKGGAQQQDTLADVREEEAREAAQRLAITDIQFWKQPDRALKVTELLLKRVVELVQETQPGSVFFPSSLELHPDHRITAALIWKGLRRCPKFAGTAYSYEIATQGPINLLIDITEVAEEKFAIMEVYNSQLTENNYLQIVKALNVTRTYTLARNVKYAEGFYAYKGKFYQELAFPILSSLQLYWQFDTQDDFPLVSVIIRTKDRPELLKEAIQSVVKQAYSNIELIVVNDGGQDVSELVNAVSGKFSHLQYISLETNQGRAGAANKGLDLASGDYLIFLDDDDLFDPHHIATLVESLQQHPHNKVAYTGARFEGRMLKKMYNRLYDREGLRKENYIPFHTVMFARALLVEGCRFDERLVVFEDWDFLLQLSQYTDFRHIGQVSATYRALGTSNVTLQVDRRITDQARAIIAKKWNTSEQRTSANQQHSVRLFAQLFIDTGSGFNEEQSLCHEISCYETQLTFYVAEYEAIRMVRFDPINTRAVIKIAQIDLISEDYAVGKTMSYQTNALHHHDGTFIFETNDPNIFVDTSGISCPQQIVIHLEYLAWGTGAYKYIAEEQAAIIHIKEQEIQTQGQILQAREQELQQLTHDLHKREQKIQAIYNTFSWRLTRPLRGIWNILHLSELFYGLRKTITYIRTRTK